jgi:hypothetical protein
MAVLPKLGEKLEGRMQNGRKDVERSLVSVAKSQIVILSEAKDLENHGDSSLRSE